jgi:hypothetical protein
MAEKAEDRAAKAGLEFACRELKFHRPDGTFDEGARFYPSEKEARDCCANIRAPSRAFPFSLMKHCRTAKHVAKLYGVTEKAVRAEAEKVRQQLWYLCKIRDFDRIRDIIESPTFDCRPIPGATRCSTAAGDFGRDQEAWDIKEAALG